MAATAGIDAPLAAGTGYTFIFTSDNHGNNAQYQKLVEASLTLKVNALLLGGDISPKCQYAKERDYYGRMEREQREWIARDFKDILSPLKTAGIKVYVILGNGDVSANYEKAGYYEMVDCRRVVIHEHEGVQYELVGLPFINPCWSSMKDFEAHDTIDYPGECKNPLRNAMISQVFDPRCTYFESDRVVPYHSVEQRIPDTMRTPVGEKGWRPVTYPPDRAKTHSLEVYLKSPLYAPRMDAGRVRRTILMSHAPPFGTVADMLHSDADPGGGCGWCELYGLTPRVEAHGHCGSIAVREYIELHRPWMTLHGHIHSTVECAGTFLQHMRDSEAVDPAGTYVITSGNDPLYTVDGTRHGRRAETPRGKAAWGVLVDLVHPASSKQLVL